MRKVTQSTSSPGSPSWGGGVLSGGGILGGRALHGRRRLVKNQRPGGAHERAPLPYETNLAKIDGGPDVDIATKTPRRTFTFCAAVIVGLVEVVSIFDALGVCH